MRYAALLFLLGCDIQGAIGDADVSGAGGANGEVSVTAEQSSVAVPVSGAGGSTTTSANSASSSAESVASSSASSSAQSSSAMSSSASGGPGPVDPEQLCVDTINNYRATLGLAPLARWNDAESCSDQEAISDSKSMKPHGAFGMCGEWGQNECPNWPGPPEKMIPQCLAMMWAEGPGDFNQGHGHYLNMSSKSFTKVACGYSNKGAGSLWAVQNFK